MGRTPAINQTVPQQPTVQISSQQKTGPTRAHGKMRLLPLIGATYFMVAGGPYGLEDVIGKAGYLWALVMLALVPLLWSLPTALMVGELASAMPEEGGYYIWVRRALGPFWGFQEAWLSLAASVFDMAIYPVTFTLYLARLAPGLTAGHRGVLWSLAVVIGCTLWNLRGAKAVGEGSVLLFVVLLAPFAVLVAAALYRWHLHASGALLTPDYAGALSVCLWNYMGWDNASTVAQEVEDPQRNYPRAMVASAGLVALTYILPLLAVGLFGLAPEKFSTGAWTDAARTIVGPALALAVVAGGMINGAGMFNPLMMSYTRVPYAMALERECEARLEGRDAGMWARLLLRVNGAGVPWVSVVFCAVIWSLALGFTFERLISIDLVLYGSALLLEFVALVVLRRREPAMARPFRVPGGMVGAVGVGVGPALLIGFAMWAGRGEKVLGVNALLFAGMVAVAGACLYGVGRLRGKRAG